ncbi:polysaccharide deacetylase family protein [Mesorhizobium australicum]|uniref:Polysaccharide deacetylase n=1 Tax=Mesorhizobium australicum TaxID=536018 RepID=A0A1X7MSS4_9HYPH|nr:polysaccharide deacetylase family protein [Mesorhizobium australicum]SMH27765.1 Polysaccharide deacetylase [Mesorhizobium australicum]
MSDRQGRVRVAGTGYDHTIFGFRGANEPAPFVLPDGKELVVTPIVVLQRFHIDAKPPFAVPGMLARPWPDIGTATQREVGLHDGLRRVLDAFDEAEAAATFVVEADALPHLPDMRKRLAASPHGIVAGGRHAVGLHGSHLTEEEEAGIIAVVKTELEAFFGREVAGWRSPYNAQSASTLSLLARNGFSYCGDLNNDERPYMLDAGGQSLWAVSMPHTTSDLHNIEISKQTAEDFFLAQLRGIDWLLDSSERRPIVYPLVLHPWIVGVPHRIAALASFLRDVASRRRAAFWSTDQLVAACRR